MSYPSRAAALLGSPVTPNTLGAEQNSATLSPDLMLLCFCRLTGTCTLIFLTLLVPSLAELFFKCSMLMHLPDLIDSSELQERKGRGIFALCHFARLTQESGL